MMMRLQSLLKATLGLILLTSSILVTGQSFSNIRAELIEGQMRIRYDLNNNGNTNELFRVELRTSVDNFSTPMKTASGDIGENVTPGRSLSIFWDPASELPEDYDGQLQFKLVGEPMTPVEEPVAEPDESISFSNPKPGSKFKRGKTTFLEWSGTDIGNYKLELYRAGNKISDLTNINGNNSFSWLVPENLEPGTDYELRLSGADDQIVSETFSIKGKTSIFLVIAPIAVAGGVAGVLASGGGESSGGGGSDALPAPPDPGQ